jgi:hypothetical protein
MRKTINALPLIVAVGACLGLVSLLVFQGAWLKLISYLLNSNASAGLPTTSPPITGFSLPTAAPPAPPGKEAIVGNLAITVTRVVRPADSIVENTGGYNSPEQDEHYLLVDIRVRCVSSAETCHLTEFDFGVSSSSGRDYTAEFASGFSGLDGLFEGGDIRPGNSLAGSLIFIVHKSDTGLKLIYPRMYSFGGPSAEFLLER